ncbi:MAG: hypothetical protein K5Q00_00210 [Gammaproteobacteria bacterium]|nr:hypothetical protein [Gammaproteobacteria bacterium]
MSIRSQFKQTSLIVACLTTLLPIMASAALTHSERLAQEFGESQQLGLASLQAAPAEFGLSVAAENLNASVFNVGAQSISPSAALERDKVAAQVAAQLAAGLDGAAMTSLRDQSLTGVDVLNFAESTLRPVSGDPGAVEITGLTPTSPLLFDNGARDQGFVMWQPELVAEQATLRRWNWASWGAQLEVLRQQPGWETNGLGPAVFDPPTSIQISKAMLGSTLQVPTANGAVVLQLPSGTKLSAANAMAALNRFQRMVSVAPTSGGVTFKTPGAWANTLAADEAITHSRPKTLYVMDGAVDKNGNLTANATQLLSSVKLTAGDSAIVVGSSAAATATAKALMASGVASTQLRTVSFQPTNLELAMGGMSGASAAGSSAAASTTSSSVTTGLTAANTQMVAVQVVHQANLQDTVATGEDNTQALSGNS